MSILANRSLRLKVALPALVAMLALLATLGAALSALRSADRGAEGLYQRSAKALAALGDVRDGEGDSRVDALTLARVTDPADIPDVQKDIADANGMISDGLAAFQAAARPTGQGRRACWRMPRVKIAAWQHIRDNQLLAAVKKQDAAEVSKIVDGPLSAADDAFGRLARQPLHRRKHRRCPTGARRECRGLCCPPGHDHRCGRGIWCWSSASFCLSSA